MNYFIVYVNTDTKLEFGIKWDDFYAMKTQSERIKVAKEKLGFEGKPRPEILEAAEKIKKTVRS